jgi:transposase
VAFHEISIMDIWEIIRRWYDHQSLSQIAQGLGYDRKTVRRYVRLAESKGLSHTKPLPGREDVLALLTGVEYAGGRTPQARSLLDQYLPELVELVGDPDLSLLPKNAFEVLCERHGLDGKVSYSSFKRFIQTHRTAFHNDQITCRFEADPGSELQIDYAKVGTIYDHATKRRRVLYVFIGTLAHSRHKYIELVFTQDQTSFVSSHVRMFEYFGGVPRRIVLDNLKAGVIKPDLYTPQINRAYQEMAEHYHCFLDTCRVARPQDKGKVERDVRTVRQAVRKILVLNPGAALADLNQMAKRWSIDAYGLKPHGTTHELPYTVFTEREQPLLMGLPVDRFEIAEWKIATVHPDHYIQFKGRSYSVASAYIGKKVWIRATERILQVFCDDRLIKQHIKRDVFRHTDPGDFPENFRAVLDAGFHRHLLSRAEAIGPHFHQMIRSLLELQAFINLRRAQGLVAIAEHEEPFLVDRAAAFILEHRLSPHPRAFRDLLAKLRQTESTPLPVSQETLSFVRDVSYFIRTQEGNQ